MDADGNVAEEGESPTAGEVTAEVKSLKKRGEDGIIRTVSPLLKWSRCEHSVGAPR